MLLDDHVWECSDESLNIESDSQLGPNFPKKEPSLATIVAPSNFPHSQEFTSADKGKDIKDAIKIQFFINTSFQFVRRQTNGTDEHLI